MSALSNFLIVVVAVGLLNVWLLRFNKATNYRGGDAKNLIEEFAVYGLPAWFCYLIGFLKVGSAICLLVGFFVPKLILPAAALIVCLMLGAVSMHAKVRDPIVKALPATSMLLMSAFIVLSRV